MIYTTCFVLEFWIFWVFLYLSGRFYIETIYHPNSSDTPVPGPEVPVFFEYDHVEICGKFIFDREEEAKLFEVYLDHLQEWIYLNNFRPMSCLKDNKTIPFFQHQTIKSISQKILVELFSVDRDTRLKELLRELCSNADDDNTILIVTSIVIIISTYFGLKIMKIDIDGNKMLEEVPMVLSGVLGSSRNLFLCDFMLHHLTSSANANEIISKHDLDTLLSIDTSVEGTYLANFLNQIFMKPVKEKRSRFPKRMLFGNNNGEKNYQSALFKDYAENALKDIRLFQTILTNLPEKNDDDDNNHGDNNHGDNNNGDDNNSDDNNSDNNNSDNNNSDNNNNNNDDDDDDDDDDDEEDKKMKEWFDTIKRMAGIPVYEELEFDAPIQTKYPNIRREKHGTEEHNVAKEDLVEEEKDTEIYDPVYEEEETEIYNQEEEAPSYQKSAPMTFYPRAGKYDYFDTVDEEKDTQDDEQYIQDEEQDIQDEEQGIQYEEEDIQDENQGIENEEQEEGSSRKRYSPVLSGIDELSSYQENAFETFDYNRARVERRPSWPLVKSGSQILYRLVDDLGSIIVDENEVMRILRHHYEELVNNPGSPISEVLVTSLYHNNPSIRDFAYALIFRIPPSTTPGTPFTPPVRYRSNSVDDQIDFDGYGYPPEPLFYYVRSDNDVDYSTSSLSNQNTASELDQDVPFVFHPVFVPSPLSENNDDNADQDESNVVVNTESELDQDVPFVSNTDFEPSPVSKVNDPPEIMSIVSGEYIPDNEAESNAGRIPSGTEPTITNSASHYSTDSTVSLLRVPNNTVSENAIPSDLDSFLDTPPYTQFEIDCISNNVYHWMHHNVYTGSEAIDIPRVVDTDEEEEHRWEYLGFDEYDRDGFAHLFFKLPRATFPDLQELRDKMDMIKQTFRKLTSDTYVRFFNHQVLLDDMLPESVDILEEVQMAYREMVYQYINYQRSLEEYELGYTLLGTIEFIDCYKHHIRSLLYKLEEESVKEVSALNQPVFESVYKTMCEGTQMVANLKRTWKTYVESSSAFKNVQKTYQGSIDKIEQEFVTIVGDFYIIYETYLIMRSG